jgi:hypothetical protein
MKIYSNSRIQVSKKPFLSVMWSRNRGLGLEAVSRSEKYGLGLELRLGLEVSTFNMWPRIFDSVV